MTKTSLPDHYSLSQLYINLLERGGDGVSQTLGLLEQHLLRMDGINREPDDSHNARRIFNWVAVAIKPVGNVLVEDSPTQIKDLVSASTAAFKCIRQLQTYYPSQELVSPDALLGILAFTDVRDPWTREATQREAENVLNYYRQQLKSREFLVEHVLEGFIRPLFSDSGTHSVTSEGRKAITQTVQKPHYLRNLNASNKSWKFREVSAMSVLNWAIRTMDENMFQHNWHLCIPPLLTILDDSSTIVRNRGLQILCDLLRKIPPKTLQQTGLGEVFEDTVMPTLLFLPELTPIEESVSLLTSAYFALSLLGEVRYPGLNERGSKMRFMDRIMRQGVLQGFIHSGDNVRIAKILVEEMVTVFGTVGVHAVKYLKDTIPILSRILTDPFGPSHPSLLLAAAKAIQTTVANCWPRMTESNHRIELVKALTLCWATVNGETRVNDETGSLELEAVKHELQVAGTTLVTAVSGKLDMKEELEPLLHADPSLGSLFGIDAPLN